MHSSAPTQHGPREAAGPHYAERALALYDERYADRYADLYLAPWQRKHQLNVRNLARIFATLAQDRPDWLDLACGQAWHFSMFGERARMCGLDLSPAQLARARQRVPQADFVCADMACAPLPAGAFDLVTNFWGGYCYLESSARIEALLRDAVRWLRPGGTLYIEVLLGRDLADFNRSRFAHQTGFAVLPHAASANARVARLRRRGRRTALLGHLPRRHAVAILCRHRCARR